MTTKTWDQWLSYIRRGPTVKDVESRFGELTELFEGATEYCKWLWQHVHLIAHCFHTWVKDWGLHGDALEEGLHHSMKSWQKPGGGRGSTNPIAIDNLPAFYREVFERRSVRFDTKPDATPKMAQELKKKGLQSIVEGANLYLTPAGKARFLTELAKASRSFTLEEVSRDDPRLEAALQWAEKHRGPSAIRLRLLLEGKNYKIFLLLPPAYNEH